MSKNFRRPLALATLLVAASGSLAPPVALAGEEWVTYVDESSSRIISSADPNVGQGDGQEKDMISGDVDQDGDFDLVIVRKLPFSNPGGRRNALFMNEGGIMVESAATLAPDFLDITDDRDVALVDLDGDGWLDLVTAGTFGEQPRVLINLGDDGDGNWLGFDYQSNRLPTLSPGPNFCTVAVGDVSGDKVPDVYFTDYDNTLEDRLLINDGSGFFTDETATRMTAAMASSVFGTDAQIVDLNGDGFNDIIKNNASGSSPPPGFSPRVTVLYNDGTGNFDFRDDIYTLAPYMIEVADFTQDGRLDIFVVDDGQDRYLINTGNDAQGHAEFSVSAVSTSPATAFFGGNVKYADLDGDNVLDVLVADADTDLSGCNRRLTLIRGQGTPPNVTYSDPLNGADRPWLHEGVYDVEPLHINNDGVLDLWIGSCSGNFVFMGDNSGIFGDSFESGNTLAWSETSP